MERKAYAKINLTLDITGIMPGGYHSLFTVMHTAGCYDIISVNQRTDGRIVLSADRDYIPLDGKNTCYRAAALFYELTGIRDGCDIDIKNRVPSGAGLGNSSADAAAVLKILNGLYSFPLEDETLCRASAGIGADVPFTYARGTRLCLGVGDEMTELPRFNLPFVIVKKPVSFPTAGAYARYDALEAVTHPDNEKFLACARRGEWKRALSYAGNVFEQVQPAEDIADIKSGLLSRGAFFASMTGSGSAVFGVFDADFPAEELEETAEYFRSRGCFAFADASCGKSAD